MVRRQFLLLLATTAAATSALACRRDASSDEPIGPPIAPAALAARLDEVKRGKIVVLYMGPDALFKRGRIPGARNIGAADSAAGLAAVRDALATIPAETEIALYCGCCPVRNCPNVRPVSAAIRASGRKNAFVVDLPTRFSADWADLGYPVERG